MIHTVKGFGVVNKAEVDVFLELSCFFYDWTDVGNLISGSSFSKSSLNFWNFTVHVLLKPDLKNFEHYFGSMWDDCNCAVVWAFFGIAFLWDWNESRPFPVLWPLLSFPKVFHRILFNQKNKGNSGISLSHTHTQEKVALKGHLKWNKSRKANTVWSHIYVESRRGDFTEKETRFVITTGRV